MTRPRRAALVTVVVVLLVGGLVLAQQVGRRSTAGYDVALAPPQAQTVPLVPVSEVRAAPAAPAEPSAAASRPVVDPAWLVRTATAAGIPEPALRAYARAQLSAPASCHLGWTTLAGVGWVESQHGTLGGQTLLADGRSSVLILGPALDGSHHTRAIAATSESALLTGDPVWDHAVGPLQFIPSTWEQWAADGDGDGVADPQDLDDAALAAAHYLCADGHDLATATGWTDAVLSYNRSRDYLQAVHDAASDYAGRTA